MLDSAQNILTHINMYSVSLITIVCIVFLSSISEKFKHGVKIPLQICITIWVIFFGYKVYTGNNLYAVMTTPSQSEIEAAKYEKVVIDGREVFYNKNTGEVVKKIK
jgi:type IV secretory pathway VirB6-like protein